jgi:hypothetical protein
MALTVILPSGVSNTGNFAFGSVSTTGNITGNYILGNGALLTGVSTTSSNINNGTSNVTVVSSGGNVSVGIGGTSNVAVFATTGEFITGLLSVSGNVTGGNLVTSGSGGNISGANVISGTTLSATGNMVANNVVATTIVNAASLTGGLLSVSGNITANNALFTNIVNVASFTGAVVSVSGNITGNYFIGNGSQLTGISNISNGTSNIQIVAANANATVNIGGISNVVVYATTGEYVTGVISASGNVTAGNISTAGNVNGANIVATTLSATSNVVAAGGTFTGNISTTGNVQVGNLSTAGNVNSAFFVGSNASLNGLTVTGLITLNNISGPVNIQPTAGIGNIVLGGLSQTGDITLGRSSVTGNTIIAGGAISAANTKSILIGQGGVAGSNTTVQIGPALGNGNVVISANTTVALANTSGTALSVAGNITGGNLNTTGTLSTSGNIAANNVIATTIVSAASHTGTLISVTGNIQGGNVITTGIAQIQNNLIVNAPSVGKGGQLILAWGNTPNVTGQANQTWNLDVDSSNVFRVFYQNSAGASSVLIQANAASNIVTFPSTAGISVSGNVNAGTNYFIGNGSQLTGITASGGASITNGTSNVVVAASGNVTVAVAGTPSVATFTTSGMTANIVAATNNGNGTNFKVGDDAWIGDVNNADTMSVRGQQNAANGYIVFGNADSTTTLGRSGTGPLTYLGAFSATGNVNGGNLISAALVQGATVSSSGNVVVVGVAASGNISATANVQGGNGVFTTIVSAASHTGTIVSVTGNITAAGGVFGSGNISTTGNVQGGNFVGAVAATTVSASGNVNGGNLITAALVQGATVSSSGNVVTVGVAASGNISATANVQGGNGVFTTIVSAASHTGGLVSVTGTVTGSQFNGSGAGLSSIPGANVTGTLSIPTSSYAATVSSAAQPNITSVGTLTSLAVTGQVNAANGVAATTIAAQGWGVRVVAGSGDTQGIIQFTNFAQNAQWATITSNAVNSLLLNATTTQATGSFVTPGTITVNSGAAATAIINGAGNAVGNIGSSGTYFNRLFAQATTALYADLAEMYTTDAEYKPGTVMIFGGNQEVTISTTTHDYRVAGVVSTNPAHVMNSGLQGEFTVAVALTGRVPVSVIGNISAGDRVVTSNRAGVAEALDMTRYQPGVIIGKALQSHTGDQVGVIEVVVGRL